MLPPMLVTERERERERENAAEEERYHKKGLGNVWLSIRNLSSF